ncbi:uncharacterized protein [Physcomitrium patens]|uniref:Uncharacterized protein n=1 Tax=Physcomitrium patens TaxID=3218 RepID=A0A7I3ZI18_PHYPA|nr:uncharacterized protein LOC112282832 [Physcomitrium patens]|eukprot:XP_024376678.1 uncharacterized protein LOC112282832 [Physcomitrella patens]
MRIVESEAMGGALVSGKWSRGSTLRVLAAVGFVVVMLRMPVAVAHVTGQQALVYTEQMATMSMNLWKVTGPGKDRFQYELGTILRGIELVHEATQKENYLDYIKYKVDRFVYDDGTITSYVLDEFQLDSILTGRLLLTLFKATGANKYKTAADLLREQLRKQPRTHEGGFWHKNVYPYQIWLDGLYMAEPFYAQYAMEFKEDDDFDDIAAQFIITEKRMRDSKTGLLYHGYDESRVETWSDPVTGCSPSIWGRGVGWFTMALVDTLDYFPDHHPKRPELLAILIRIAVAVKSVQDPQSGLWWEVMDKGGDAGNYLESSASAMFVYSLAKGVRLGYLTKGQFHESVLSGYDGIVSHFVQVASDGGVSYTGTVSVGGLGGNPYRNGSYAYYLSEEVVSNDPKGVGSFLMASVENLRVSLSD